MMNLLRAEVYKLRKSKCFFIMCALSIALMLLNFVTVYIFRTNGAEMLKEAGEQAETMRATMEVLSNMGTLDVMQKTFGQSNSLMCAVIFICVFALSEYSHGAMKNIVGKGYRKEQIYLSKFVGTEVGALLIYLVTVLACLLAGIGFEGYETLDAAFFENFAKYTMLNLLFLTSVTAIVLFVSEAVRNMAAGITISLLGIVFGSSLLVQGIDAVIRLLHSDVSVADYWIVSIINQCPTTDFPTKFVTTSAIAAVVWLVLALAGGMCMFGKRDVK